MFIEKYPDFGDMLNQAHKEASDSFIAGVKRAGRVPTELDLFIVEAAASIAQLFALSLIKQMSIRDVQAREFDEPDSQ